MDQYQLDDFQGFDFPLTETGVYSDEPTHYMTPSTALFGVPSLDHGYLGIEPFQAQETYDNSMAPDAYNFFQPLSHPTALQNQPAVIRQQQTISPSDLCWSSTQTTPSMPEAIPDLAISQSRVKPAKTPPPPIWSQHLMLQQPPFDHPGGLHAIYYSPEVGHDAPIVEYGGEKQEHPTAVGEGGTVDNGEESYAVILAEALKADPEHTMPLKQLYDYVQEHSTKARESTDGGWKNSVRHNLSMNEAFERVEATGARGKKKSSMWRLSDKACREGVHSTTRYRKAPKHPKQKSSVHKPAAPKRQQSGAKGGKATKAAAARRKQEATQQPVGASHASLPQRALRSHALASSLFGSPSRSPQHTFGAPAQMQWHVAPSSPSPFGRSGPYYGHEGGYLQSGLPEVVQESPFGNDFDSTPSAAMMPEMDMFSGSGGFLQNHVPGW